MCNSRRKVQSALGLEGTLNMAKFSLKDAQKIILDAAKFTAESSVIPLEFGSTSGMIPRTITTEEPPKPEVKKLDTGAKKFRLDA